MRWTERQRELLGGMGLRVWSPAGSSQRVEPPPHQTPLPSPGRPPRPAGRVSPKGKVILPVVDVPPQTGTASAAQNLRDAEVAGLDWPALREAVAVCRACTLGDSRTNAVFGMGHAQAHWMIVGEAPGENEDLRGEPFVGAAGQLLDAMLRALGLSRDEGTPERQVFIANTLKCRPPRNRNPLPEELAQCEPFLKRQIALVQPRVILAMGKFAIQQLLGTDEPVGRLRGRVHACQGVPVVVTYHPAYLLRQLSEKAKAWDDLRLAKSVYDRAMAAADA